MELSLLQSSKIKLTEESVYPAGFIPVLNCWAHACCESSSTKPTRVSPSVLFGDCPVLLTRIVWAEAAEASVVSEHAKTRPTNATQRGMLRRGARATRPSAEAVFTIPVGERKQRRAPARRARPAGRTAAAAVDGEGWPPRGEGRRSGGNGGRHCSRGRGAVTALGALNVHRTDSVQPLRTREPHRRNLQLAPARSDDTLPPARLRTRARVARAR